MDLPQQAFVKPTPAPMPFQLRSVPLHSEWWIVPTREGWLPIPHAPARRDRAMGPFSTLLTANMKAEELTRRDRMRRFTNRGLALVTAITSALAVLTLV